MVTLTSFPNGADAFPDGPYCEYEDFTQRCDREDFSAYSATPTHVNLGANFTSPNGFYFEIMDSPQFQVHNFANLGNALYLPPSAVFFVLPTPRESLSFQLMGPGTFEILVYDDSFNYMYSVEETVTSVAKTILLNVGIPIGGIVIQNVSDDGRCDTEYYEPFITGIVACDP